MGFNLMAALGGAGRAMSQSIQEDRLQMDKIELMDAEAATRERLAKAAEKREQDRENERIAEYMNTLYFGGGKKLKDFINKITKMGEKLSYECGDPAKVEKIFREDIVKMVEALINDKKESKKCPPGKIINPKTGRCINKPKQKSKKVCSPSKIINPKTGRCINKPKQKTYKKRGRPKKDANLSTGTLILPERGISLNLSGDTIPFSSPRY